MMHQKKKTAVIHTPAHRHTIHGSYQPLVPCKDDSVEHGFIKKAVAHPFRYDDVNLLHWKLHLLHLSFKNGDN